MGASSEADQAAPDGGGDVEMESENAQAPQDDDIGFAGFIRSLEPTKDDEIAEMLLTQLGAGRSYTRERLQAIQKFIVSEVYSSPRTTKDLRDGRWKHLVLGFAVDHTVEDPFDSLP